MEGVKGKGFIPSVEDSECPCQEVLTVGVLTFVLCSDTCNVVSCLHPSDTDSLSLAWDPTMCGCFNNLS